MKLIESDTWRLWSDPSNGAQWMSAEVYREGDWHAVVPECRPSADERAGQDEKAPLAAANFHMVPYSNRIRDARFNFQGRTIELQEAAAHAIHGAVRKLPWKVTAEDRSHLVCEFDSTEHSPVNWPWPIHARLEQRVEGSVLTSQLTLTNRGDTPMPAGFGWHPYFVRNVNGSEPTLTLPVSGVFPDEAGDCLPDGAPVPLPSELDFRHPRLLDATQRIDCCLSGLNGQCDIDWREGGIKLQVTSSESCKFLVLFNPDMPHFAVEPVTNANDAFNLAEQGIESGMQVLAAGESMQATMSLRAVVS